MKDHKGNEDGKRGGKKRKAGFFSLLFLFASGFTAGLGTAAFVAYHVNQVELPFIAPPTRDAPERNFLEPEEPEDESLQFHQILRDRVPPPAAGDQEETARTPAAEEPRPTPAPAAHFVLVGSFNERDQAEAILGELALINLRAAVREVRGQGGQVFRVFIGPFPTPGEAEEVRAQLAFNGYNSSLVSANSR